MKTTATKSYQKTSSKSFLISFSALAEYGFLLLIGMLAVTIHAKMRIPLKLPGHHGIEFIALLMAGRVVTKNEWAARISTLGAGVLLLTPFLSFKDPFMSLIILVPGIAIDILYNNLSRFKKNYIFAGLVGGFSYMLIPIARLIISFVTGFPYESLLMGALYPILTHFIFGMSGAIIAYSAISGVKKLIK